MKKILAWLKAIWRWVKQANHLWFALSVAIFSIAYICHNPNEQSIRLMGLALQVLGILTVAWGIKETRELFGHPSFIKKSIQWFKSFPPYGGRISTGNMHGILGAPTLNARSYSSTSIDKDSSIEDRLVAIESNLNKINERISQTENNLYDKIKFITETVAREKSLREQADNEIHQKLETVSTGGIHISATGALWLLLGVTMSTAPNELLALAW